MLNKSGILFMKTWIMKNVEELPELAAIFVNDKGRLTGEKTVKY